MTDVGRLYKILEIKSINMLRPTRIRVEVMKQILVTLIFVLVSSMSNAQYVPDFKMNYDGNFTTQKGESYDVAVMEGKSATELFDKVKKNVALVFRSPKEVESNVDDKIISIYGYAPKCTYMAVPGWKYYLSFHYSLKFQFKDGKIRIEAPGLYEMEGSAWSTLQKTFKGWHIFNKDGELSKKEKNRLLVTMLEDYFNDLINRIINGDTKSNEDW